MTGKTTASVEVWPSTLSKNGGPAYNLQLVGLLFGSLIGSLGPCEVIEVKHTKGGGVRVTASPVKLR